MPVLEESGIHEFHDASNSGRSSVDVVQKPGIAAQASVDIYSLRTVNLQIDEVLMIRL